MKLVQMLETLYSSNYYNKTGNGNCDSSKKFEIRRSAANTLQMSKVQRLKSKLLNEDEDIVQTNKDIMSVQETEYSKGGAWRGTDDNRLPTAGNERIEFSARIVAI